MVIAGVMIIVVPCFADGVSFAGRDFHLKTPDMLKMSSRPLYRIVMVLRKC